jgi:hypothetical protein
MNIIINFLKSEFIDLLKWLSETILKNYYSEMDPRDLAYLEGSIDNFDLERRQKEILYRNN